MERLGGGVEEWDAVEGCGRLWGSGGVQALQIHFCFGGTSALWALLYPAGALDDLRTPAGRARWMVGVEEAFADTRLEISSLPGAEGGSKQWASLSVGSWGGGEAWRAERMSSAGMREVVDRLDEIAGAASARARPKSLLFFGDIADIAQSAREGSEKRGGASLEAVVGAAMARREREELDSAAEAGGSRPAPKM